ncbi:hypothetical protein C5167_026695 [Papaver somniferum]|nr:hypothetical protein C5167_026695 [Papaver somniferum]
MGDADAQYELGRRLRVENPYVQSEQQAFYYLEKAIEQMVLDFLSDRNIHAKEMEKNDIQVKSKEIPEKEINYLGKSLAFKAMPMPTFYKEPISPIELKKAPQSNGSSESSTQSSHAYQCSSSYRNGRILHEKLFSAKNKKVKELLLEGRI